MRGEAYKGVTGLGVDADGHNKIRRIGLRGGSAGQCAVRGDGSDLAALAPATYIRS